MRPAGQQTTQIMSLADRLQQLSTDSQTDDASQHQEPLAAIGKLMVRESSVSHFTTTCAAPALGPTKYVLLL